jgi:hypothetical protein
LGDVDHVVRRDDVFEAPAAVELFQGDDFLDDD